MKHKKRALFQSLISLLLCFSMLVGTTFAWFTDSVSSGWNTIAAGTLDVEMEYRDANGNWLPVNEATEVLDRTALWEPGYTEVAYLRITNAGKLALKYALGIRTVSETGSVNADGQAFLLSDYIQFGVVESQTEQPAFATRTEARNALDQPLPMSQGLTAYYTLLPEENMDVRYATLVVYMPEEVGNAANYATGQLPPQIQLGIELVATQADYESDAFGTGYDATADIPGFSFPNILFGGSVSAGVTPGEDNKVTENVTIPGSNMNAVVPAGVLLDEQTDKLTLEIAPVAESQANVTLGENEEALSLDVHIQGVAAGNTQPMEITMKGAAAKGLNNGNLKLYHVETDAEGNKTTVEMTRVETFDAHNQFKYDPNTGDVVLYMATFSEVAMVADTNNKWNGDFDYSWYTKANARSTEEGAASDYIIANADQLAGFGAIVGGMNGQTQDSFKGKSVTLIADVDLGDKEDASPNLFYPIGYYNSTGSYEKTSGGSVTSSVSSFEGTFDGNGHTIANFYQNTWEMFGDYNDGYSGTPNHYKDAMGLFGYVLNGTVKNLTVDNFSSDGEYTPTGVIAAYADGNTTFENIAITHCNPRVYNTGNGGIIGIAGDTSAANDDHITLKNITVDNSNKISALWGSWDVACGGLVGMYRGNVDGNGNPTGDTISFKNCHVAAQIDVNNDVCANYQYYAYRYAGMIIGSVRHNTTNKDGKTIPDMQGISASGCTVNYGTWNDYYYCEFEKNSMASYSEDYQFSRVDKSEIIFDENGKATGCTHTHTDAEDKRAVYLPFHQLFTGYGWGVNSVGLETFGGITVEGSTDVDVSVGDQQESVEKFETKFTGGFLYRVGNQNSISVDSLFAAVPKLNENGEKQYDENGKLICWDINDAGTYVRIDKLYEDANVKCTFNPADDGKEWTEGTLKFEGTGVVDIVIQDYDYCTPTILHLEVVDAVNATSATSATENNVVLLNDCGFSSLEVSGGYTLYGNGFTMTCANDSASLSFGQFVDLNNGALDNVQIVCPNYDYAALYSSQLKGKENRSETTNGTERYFNAKSAVLATGNSQILNSRISGGRAALYASSGNVVVDNSRLEGGAVATVLIGAANSFVFRDAELIQKPTVSTHDKDKTLMGMSVLYLCDTSGNATPTKLEGSLVQNAWADESCVTYMPEGTDSIVSAVFSKDNYIHEINNKDCVNLGFAYMPNDGTKVNQPSNISDNRINRESVPYAYESVSADVPVNGVTVSISTYVYSYKNTSGTDNNFIGDQEYNPDKYSDIVEVIYADSQEGLTNGKSYGTEGWIYELNVDLDKVSGYVLDFGKMSMTINGVAVSNFQVNGSEKPVSPVPVTAGGTTYTLTATLEDKEYTATYIVTGVETSKRAPYLVDVNGNEIMQDAISWGAGKCVTRKDDAGSTNYTGAAPVLEGINIKYWSVAQGEYIKLSLKNLTPQKSTGLNGTNNYWEYTDPNGDFSLKITNTAYVHDSNKVYAMPVSDGSTMYFVASAANGLVSTGSGARNIAIKYEFKDNNGGELIFNHTWSVGYNSSGALKYVDLTGIKDGCVTPDTLITLADGSQVRVDSLTGKEELLVWNLETGKYDTASIVFVDTEEEMEYEIIHLYFSDGSDVKVISEHGFFDLDLGKYVYVDADNYADYVGHRFVTEGDIKSNSWNIVTLDEVALETEVTTAWSPVTFEHLCYYTNGVLSMPGGIEGLFNIFDVNTDTMCYDEQQMRKDIETYGLFTLADFGGMISEEAFEAFNGAYLKIAMAKGLLTWEDIAYMAERYIPLM